MSGHESGQVQPVRISVADPSAIGLFGLAIVTLVASSQKLGLTSETAFIVPWAIFLGAFAQLYASITEAKIGNTFGFTAFAGYAFFWFGVAGSWLIKYGVFGETMMQAADTRQLGVAYIGYLIFSLFMTYGAAGTHKVLFIIFVLIDLLFIGLFTSALGIAHEAGHVLAAYSELLIAVFSFYGFGASVLNVHYGKTVLPVGKPLIAKG